MTRILFVCHGNICRSPMAEFILKDMVEKRGTAHEYFISSAATSTEEIYNGIGNPVYPPAQRELALHGISCGGKRAVQLRKSDYDKYDYIIGMDSANIRNMHIILGGDRDKKILKLKELTDGGDVADPWYSGDFAKTYEDIYKGCEALLKMIEK
ncbi:MAG: low molecular weight protein-tyrosine-phosphatase [Ruminiclostridium sp.]